MGLLDHFRSRKGTAQTAKNRLQIIIAQERNDSSVRDILPVLRQEILNVVQKFVQVDLEAIRVDVSREGDCEVLELNVTLPDEGGR